MFITEETVTHTLRTSIPILEDNRGGPCGCRSPSEGKAYLAHAALAGFEEKALAGTSYTASLDLRTLKDGTGYKVTEFWSPSQHDWGLRVSLILAPLQEHTGPGHPPQGIQTPQDPPTHVVRQKREAFRVCCMTQAGSRAHRTALGNTLKGLHRQGLPARGTASRPAQTPGPGVETARLRSLHTNPSGSSAIP